MLEILQFIFQDFTHWFGSLILLAVIVGFRPIRIVGKVIKYAKEKEIKKEELKNNKGI